MSGQAAGATVSSRPWCLVGGGGHARAIADVLQRAGAEIGAVADPTGAWRSSPGEVLPDEEAALGWVAGGRGHLAVAVGDNATRLRIVGAATARGLSLPPLVATTATVSPDAVLAPGVVVMEHAHVGPRAELGPAALVNTAAVVEHDCRVAPGVHVAPGAVLLGHAAVGEQALVGARACVLVGVTVGDGATLGAGAVAAADLPAGGTFVGVPARALSVREG